MIDPHSFRPCCWKRFSFKESSGSLQVACCCCFDLTFARQDNYNNTLKRETRGTMAEGAKDATVPFHPLSATQYSQRAGGPIQVSQFGGVNDRPGPSKHSWHVNVQCLALPMTQYINVCSIHRTVSRASGCFIYCKLSSWVNSAKSSSCVSSGCGIPGTGQHATPIVLRVTASAICWATNGSLTHL